MADKKQPSKCDNKIVLRPEAAQAQDDMFEEALAEREGK